MNSNATLFQKASNFLVEIYKELDLSGLEQRLAEVQKEIDSTGTYKHSFEELEHGARMAWRNSNRCIGRPTNLYVQKYNKKWYIVLENNSR